MLPDTCATCGATIGKRDYSATIDENGNSYCAPHCAAQAADNVRHGRPPALVSYDVD
jgi:hypothetical protein